MKQLSRFLPIVITIAIFVYAAIVLLVYQRDLLYAAQDMSIWRSDESFFEYYMQKPLGLLQYVALFLTQFFYYPWLGTLILLILWLLATILTSIAIAPRSLSIGKAILQYSPLGGWGALCLLVSITQMGYWIYYLKLPSYWFLPTLLWLWWSVALVIVSFVIHQRGCKNYFKKLPLWGIAACLWVLVLTPWNGFSLFLFDSPDTFFYLPFIVMAFVLLIQLIIGSLQFFSFQHSTFNIQHSTFSFQHSAFNIQHSTFNIHKKLPFVVLGSVLLLVASGTMNYRNECFHSELRMQQYAEHGDWQSIIDEMRHIKRTPTRQMVLMRDVALLHTDTLLLMGNGAGQCCDGIRPAMSHGPQVHMAFTAAPILYYSCGYINDAYRWTFENGVEYGWSPRRLRMLLRCAIVNGEWSLAERYIRMLRMTLFYRHFADEMQLVVENHKYISIHPELTEAIKYRQSRDVLTPTNMYCERILMLHPSSPLYNHRSWHFNAQESVHIY